MTTWFFSFCSALVSKHEHVLGGRLPNVNAAFLQFILSGVKSSHIYFWLMIPDSSTCGRKSGFCHVLVWFFLTAFLWILFQLVERSLRAGLRVGRRIRGGWGSYSCWVRWGWGGWDGGAALAPNTVQLNFLPWPHHIFLQTNEQWPLWHLDTWPNRVLHLLQRNHTHTPRTKITLTASS